MKLPQPFLDRMQAMLGNEFEAFVDSFSAERAYGLRLNRMKLRSDEEAADVAGRFRCRPVPWCPNGYYYDDSTRPGKHPYHAAGLYYIQEPSAMSAVELLDPRPGDVVLDLAAAPGGKTTQIADKLQGRGLLIANEIHPARAKILSENVERYGIANAVVVSASPDRLAARFEAFFDRIMLDAPCSGEGMFRKDPEAVGEWSPQQVEACAARQDDILNEAVKMLRPGGRLAYSTCTFNRIENEERIERLTERFPAMKLLRMERIWPHAQEGEGHFVALLEKDAGADGIGEEGKRAKPKRVPKDAEEAYRSFAGLIKEAAPEWTLPPGEPILFGEQLYWFPRRSEDGLTVERFAGIRTLRPGLHLGERKKNRLEPAHACALALSKAVLQADFAAESPEIARYLRGEAIHCPDAPNGWVVVAADGHPLGWGKASGGLVKNHYPKGLRRP